MTDNLYCQHGWTEKDPEDRAQFWVCLQGGFQNPLNCEGSDKMNCLVFWWIQSRNRLLWGGRNCGRSSLWEDGDTGDLSLNECLWSFLSAVCHEVLPQQLWTESCETLKQGNNSSVTAILHFLNATLSDLAAQSRCDAFSKVTASPSLWRADAALFCKELTVKYLLLEVTEYNSSALPSKCESSYSL